ncbi:MAG: lysine--tRNA ligase [Verrucomicrobiae bacterium]|nr:lysine--tRNA ligase [Verrucomicrobiae bacterium]
METPPLSELLAIRRQKLQALRSQGVDPFGAAFAVSGSVAEVVAAFQEAALVQVAGRITAYRDMGKSRFLDISDIGGRIQIYFNTKELDESTVAATAQLDIGDFLGVEGTYFTTKTGEQSIRASRLVVLSKSLRPLPDKWHGVQDPEICYRQRYLDLIANDSSRTIFKQRIAIMREIRRFLEARGFLEVETPMMQAVPGGAAAEPFKTHHNALGMDMFLRIAPELYLKRLLVAGFPKVFELNRNFRNEGVSRRHNPEFTMLEAYWAFADFEKMSELVEEMICDLAEHIDVGPVIEHRDDEGNVMRTINLARPWRRAAYRDLIEAAVPGWFALDLAGKRQRCAELKLDISHCEAEFEVTQHVFEKLVEEKLIDPCFVTHVPKELVPLAKLNDKDPSSVDVYELIINGQEISPGYSELNDPDLQRERLEHQAGGEKQCLDEDFLEALEYGMPPAGGIGIGIDRLVMMLTGAASIRDVILFPHLKARAEK